uniref:Ubiquitin carboxyl-terminal hydrolase 26 n=1 Tax=Cacopsylla melanoneura TaxID=428564 RepID=A0A8D8T8J5_9HEMI
MDIGEAVFTCGQSYVALSRVTASSGLHLINFNPREVKAQTAALTEYNRLRTTYRPDLPLIDCVRNKTPAVPYVKDRVWCVHRSVGEIQEKSAVPKTTDNPPPLRTRAPAPILNLRGLSNPNIACYANAIVQMLYSQLKFRDIIRSSDVSPALREHLTDYENSQLAELDSWRIRAIPPSGQFLEILQQDCQEFLMFVLAENTPMREPLTLVVSITRVCRNCNVTVRSGEEPDIMARIPVTIKKGSLTDFVNSAFNTWQQLPGYQCSNCNLVDTTQEKRVIVRTSQFVLLHLLAFNTNMSKIRETRITGVPNSRVTTSGIDFKPAAAIFHHGETLTSGHYTCYIRSGTGWMCADDSRQF